MANKSAKSGSQVVTLPDHLISEHILLRLPVKPLIRFKCVSKYWLSNISSHEFAKTHLELSSSNVQALIIQEPSLFVESHLYYLSFDEYHNINEYVKLEDKYPPFNPDPLTSRVVGSCNGLLCMYNEQLPHLYLWNPATNQCRDTHGPVLENAVNYIVEFVGFGYVSSIDDYRIGCLVLCKKFLYHVCIFSLRTGKWKEMATNLDVLEHLIGYQVLDSMFIDDTVYWAPEDFQTDRENHIIGLNLVSGKLIKIPLIDSRDGSVVLKIFRKNGCLSLCCIDYEIDHDLWIGCDVWTLKLHDDTYSWDKIFSLKFGVTIYVYHVIEKGKLLVSKLSHEFDFDELKLFDPRKVTAQQQTDTWTAFEETFFHYFTGNGWGYSESLISPFGTNVSEENGADCE